MFANRQFQTVDAQQIISNYFCRLHCASCSLQYIFTQKLLVYFDPENNTKLYNFSQYNMKFVFVKAKRHIASRDKRLTENDIKVSPNRFQCRNYSSSEISNRMSIENLINKSMIRKQQTHLRVKFDWNGR